MLLTMEPGQKFFRGKKRANPAQRLDEGKESQDKKQADREPRRRGGRGKREIHLVSIPFHKSSKLSCLKDGLCKRRKKI